jgi:hypothetical protein
MNRRVRRLVALAALCVATSLALGVGGYSAVSADRTVDVAVVEDEAAYLGVEVTGFDRCGTQALLELRNQFRGDVILDVTVAVVDADELAVRGLHGPGTLDSGESGTVTGNLTPAGGPADDRSITLRIDATGEGVDATLTRTYPVECARSNPSQSRGRESARPGGVMSLAVQSPSMHDVRRRR